MDAATSLEPLWHFLYVAFDVAAREPLNLDIADMFMAAEDFCNHLMVSDDAIPSRHKHMFSLRKEGFMQQAKFPWYSSKEWMLTHPMPLVAELQVDKNSILYRFEEFLIEADDKYHCVLNELYREWLINEKEFYVIFDADDVPRGRAVTWKEADAICDKQPLYQWDIKKNKKFASLPIMTISDK
jgi:hypothetical protein